MPIVSLPVPDRLNLDVSPSQLDPNESPDLHNMLVHEPGQLRRRKGFTRAASFASRLTVAGSDTPLQIITAPSIYAGGGGSITNTRAFVTFVTGQNAKMPSYRISSPDSVAPTGFTAYTSSDTIVAFVNADDSTALTVAAATGSPPYAALTPQAMYDNCAFWTLPYTLVVADKLGNAYGATRLMRWAGANTATSTNVWVTLNNGATTGTIWSNSGGTTPPATSYAGMFLRSTTITGFTYNYLITSHAANASAFTIQKPYGLGATTAQVPNLSLVQSNVSSVQWVVNAPPNATCCVVHYDRMFVGRPRLTSAVGNFPAGYYPNAVAWSDAGEPEKWTDTNFIQLDSSPNDAIMGFGHVGDNLVIFTRYKTWVLYGTDESSFVLRRFSDSVGCVDARSITQYQDGVFFMSDRGMYYFDGAQLTDVTQPKPGHGIRNGFQASGTYFTNATSRSGQCTTVLPDRDYLLVSAQEAQTTVANDSDSFMYFIPTQAWVEWGGSQNYSQPFVYTKPGLHLNNKAMAVTRTSLVDLSSIVAAEVPTTQNRWDQYYDTSGVAQTADVLSTVQFADFELFKGDTGRTMQLWVEHNTMYFGASDASMVGWNLYTAIDPDLDTQVTVGVVQPRWVGNVSESAALYQKYFTTQFVDTPWPLEGSVFRFKLTTEDTAQTTHRPHSSKLFRLRVKVEPTVEGRVQNPVVS